MISSRVEPSMKLSRRYNAILHVNRIALTEGTPDAVFQGMCRVLRSLMAYDRAGLTFYDPDRDRLRIAALYGSYENSVFRVGDFLDLKTTQSGWTFRKQSRTIRRDLPGDLRFGSERNTAEEGFRSLCSVPLVLHGSSVGVVTIVGRRKNQFFDRHADLVQDISNQVTLAMCLAWQRCPIHVTTRLLCPRCIGAADGKTTTLKYREDLSKWGKQGGRGRRKQVANDKPDH